MVPRGGSYAPPDINELGLNLSRQGLSEHKRDFGEAVPPSVTLTSTIAGLTAALQAAHCDARLAYEFAPGSYTFSALAAIGAAMKEAERLDRLAAEVQP